MDELTLYRPRARVNHGRWVVDCASPLCVSAMTLGPDREDRTGRVWPGLALGQVTMVCRDCGGVTDGVEWPPDPAGIELILSWRPDPENRSWEPGETLADLLRENAEHGLPVPGLDSLPAGEVTLLREIDGVAVGGHINDLLARLVGAGNRPQIGA